MEDIIVIATGLVLAFVSKRQTKLEIPYQLSSSLHSHNKPISFQLPLFFCRFPTALCLFTIVWPTNCVWHRTTIVLYIFGCGTPPHPATIDRRRHFDRVKDIINEIALVLRLFALWFAFCLFNPRVVVTWTQVYFLFFRVCRAYSSNSRLTYNNIYYLFGWNYEYRFGDLALLLSIVAHIFRARIVISLQLSAVRWMRCVFAWRKHITHRLCDFKAKRDTQQCPIPDISTNPTQTPRPAHNI